MTTQIAITNESSGAVKILRRLPRGESVILHELPPGKTHTDHVWEGSDIVVREVTSSTD